jgi:putative membrane protein
MTYRTQYYPHILSFLFIVIFTILAINPYDRDVWIVEVIPVVVIFLTLVLTFSKFQFTNISYSLMMLWLVWHTIGGHYTFANVPFDFITNLFNFERNHFDRVGHFIIGFYAYPMAEFLTRKRYTNSIVASLFGLFFIMSIAAGYEIVEWAYAVIEGGNTGIEFLGSQGDIWDAQKDMLADTLGAIVSLYLFWYIRPDLRNLREK